MKRLALLSLLLFSAPVHGDGLPVDEKGAVTAPHTVIRLSASQKEEMQALGTITLSDVQWADLRKVSPATPKRLSGILPVDYNDCTCGESWDGILLKDGGVAVLHGDLSQEALAYQISGADKIDLHVDARGQFHLNGILIRYPMLVAAIKASAPKKPSGAEQIFSSVISVPPGMKDTDSVFAERIRTVWAEFCAKGWNQYGASAAR